MKRKRKDNPGVAALCQLRDGNIHPFGAMHSFVPLGGGEERVYQQMREAIPVLDAAVAKMVRLCGGFQVHCREAEAQRRIRSWFSGCSTGRSLRETDRDIPWCWNSRPCRKAGFIGIRRCPCRDSLRNSRPGRKVGFIGIRRCPLRGMRNSCPGWKA